MKIIFSRKGFDSTEAGGGAPSPIIDGKPCSFPIPGTGPTRYGDLRNGVGELIEQLTHWKRADYCHLDPDIDISALSRPRGWRGAFGQVGPAQGHLQRQGVGRGDLFLFWGWFRPAKLEGCSGYVGESEHRIFGWLQVDDVLTIGNQADEALTQYPWLRDHPHVHSKGWPPSNTIYIASKRLRINGGAFALPGWGVFHRGLRLTAPHMPRSKWAVPDWLNPKKQGVGLSRCKPNRWHRSGLLNLPPGQEFVADISGREDAKSWLAELFLCEIESL